MKVVLNTDMSNLGRKGDVVEVAPGYARNYLLPTKRAFTASKGALKQAQTMQRSRAQQEEREKVAWKTLAGRIAGEKLQVGARAGAEGQLFGSVTTSDIAQLLSLALGEEIDRRKVTLAEPIKSVGTHSYKVHLHAAVVAEGSIEVAAEGTEDEQ
ncbi:MAG: 50S ribosomal protein L9 [Actinomycetota bacterium]